MTQQATEQQWQDLRESEARLLAAVGTPISAHDMTIHGAGIHYLEAGDARLPTLVMVHGRGGAAALWYPVVPLLAPHRHLIAVDLPGWGLSSRAPFPGKSGEDAIMWWRDAVLGVIDTLTLERFDLMGHSLGGIVSLAIALERQRSIDHLILEDAAGFAGRSPLWVRTLFNVGPERLTRSVPRALVDAIRARMAPATDHDATLQRAANDFTYTLATFPGTQQSGARAFNAFVDVRGVHFTLCDRVEEIQTPARAIWGERDHIVPLRDSRAGIATMPHADLVVIPKAGHSPHAETPQQLARLVLEGLARGTEVPVTEPETGTPEQIED
jgi:pimeloyl-ACP methyl ester carboxylesterase